MQKKKQFAEIIPMRSTSFVRAKLVFLRLTFVLPALKTVENGSCANSHAANQ
jgi:hypothetical protein